MREIKFRGQTRKLGEKVNLKGEPVPSNWVYGGIFQGVERSVIYDGETYEKHTVYNETVGQYTGLKDKNGREIYEGDILKVFVNFELRKGVEVDYIRWEDKYFGYLCSDWVSHELIQENIILEVIGNIYENPELLGDSK